MRTPSWIDRRHNIINALQAQPTYTRRDVQAIFSIGKSAAVELMRVAGANPGALTVTRADLLAYVELCPASQEIERRRKLAVKLKAAEEDLKLRAIPVPASRADEWAMLRDLPGVTIQAGVLQMEFRSVDDLLQQLHRLCKAIGNDWTEFERLCDKASKAANAQG